jgi:ketosteroid isomerase-like protein
MLVIGFATGKVKSTKKAFEDYWVFDVTVRNGKLTHMREYVGIRALAKAPTRRGAPALSRQHDTLSQ